MKKIIILIGLIILCTGCYDYKEINNVAILNGIGIDYDQSDYVVTYELLNTESLGENELIENKSYTISNHAPTIEEAITKNNNEIAKNISFENIDIMVISETIAQMGLTNIADYFIRDNNLTTNFYLVISKNTSPENLLNYKDQLKNINADAIKKLITNSNANILVSSKEQFDYLMADIKDNKEDIVIPCIEIDDSLKVNSMAVFKHDKLNYYIDMDEATIYSILKEKITNNNLLVKNDVGTIKIYQDKLNVSFTNNEFIININIMAKIESLFKNYNIKEIKNINELESIYQTDLYTKINNFINKSLENGSDILGFKESLYIKGISNFTNYDYPFKVNLKVQVNRIGGLFEVIE